MLKIPVLWMSGVHGWFDFPIQEKKQWFPKWNEINKLYSGGIQFNTTTNVMV